MKENYTFSVLLNKLSNIKGIYVLLLAISMLFTINKVQAQCTNSSSYGSATAPTSGSETFSTCSFQTEYSTINSVVSGTTYSCAISTGGYVTIRSGSYNGAVVAHGTSPLQWTATSSGTYYAHWNTNSSCGTNTGCVTTTITFVSSGGAPPCSCPAIVSTFPYSEGFETGMGYWENRPGDDFDWTRQTGGTSSGGTGPSAAAEGSYYMYTESSTPNYSNKTATMYGPCLDFSSMGGIDMSFQYHMYGAVMGTLYLEASGDNCGTWNTVWSLSGDQGNSWHTANVDLSTYAGNSSVQLRFRGLTSTSYTSDMSIDDIEIIEAVAPPCSPIVSSYPCNYMWITNVTTSGGLTNFNSTSGCSSTSYTDYSGTYSVSQVQGGVVNLSLTTQSYGMDHVVWIDFNDDLTFSAGEKVLTYVNPSNTTAVNTSFTIPVGATLGSHKMRIRSDYYGTTTPTDPCAALTYGETEDYTCIVAVAVILPITPNTPTSNSPGCGSVTITANGTPPSGETWYWQTSASGTSTTSSGSTYNVTTSGTYYIRSYRTGDGAWSAAASVAVTVNPLPTGVSAGSDVTICNGSSSQLSGSANLSTVSCSLTTTFAAGNGCGGGNMFDLTTGANPIEIDAFTILPGSTATQTVNVYYKSGSYVGSETTSGSWILLGTYSINGVTSTQYYLDIANLIIPANQTYGIYVNFNAKYTTLTANTTYSDSYLTLTAGIGLCGQFSSVCSPRAFNGIVHYNVQAQPTCSWSPTTGLSNPNILNPVATPSSTTTYTMTATASGCGVSDNVAVNVDPLPTASAGGSQDICVNETATVSGASASNGTIAWTENGAGSITSGATTLTPTYTPAAGDASGTITLTMTVTSDNACTPQIATATYTVNVDPLPTASAGGSQDICVNETATVSGASASNGTIAWTEDGAGSITSGATTLTPTYTPAAGDAGNTVTLTMTVNSNNNCSGETATGTWTVTVRPDFTAGTILSTGETICQGTDPANISSTAVASGGDNTITYKWQANGVDISGATSASYNPPGGLTVTTTYRRWAHDGTCNTGFEVAGGSWVVTVTTAPTPGGIGTGDYFWTGANGNSWDDVTNWLYYNGTLYSVATLLPSATSNVFIQSYDAGTCATTNAVTTASSTVYCEDMNIGTGLTLGGLSSLEVTGDWNNSGTFNAGNGTVAFNGSGLQTINAGVGNFNNILFDNSFGNHADIEITSPMTIEGTATFTHGIVYYSGGGSLTFINSATANVSSNNSFVDGMITKTGINEFIFPTGDVSIQDFDGNGSVEYAIAGALGIHPTGASTVTVTAQYNFSNTYMPDWWEHGGNMDLNLHHVSNRENWVVNSDQDMPVTLYWFDNTHVDDAICVHGFDDGISGDFVASDLLVAYWNGSMWANIDFNSDPLLTSFTHDAGFIRSRFPVTFGAKSNKIITFGSKSNENPLPVNLVKFEADCNNGNIDIQWTTASEINNDYFTIERSSNAKDFDQIGKIDGNGNSNNLLNYIFKDPNFSDGINYYRLTQVDYDGTSKTYNFIQASCNQTTANQSVVIYPNPFRDIIYIYLENFDKTDKINVELFNHYGQIIMEYEYQNAEISSIDLSKLPPAMYMIVLTSGDNIFTKKIIKN